MCPSFHPCTAAHTTRVNMLLQRIFLNAPSRNFLTHTHTHVQTHSFCVNKEVINIFGACCFFLFFFSCLYLFLLYYFFLFSSFLLHLLCLLKFRVCLFTCSRKNFSESFFFCTLVLVVCLQPAERAPGAALYKVLICRCIRTGLTLGCPEPGARNSRKLHVY